MRCGRYWQHLNVAVFARYKLTRLSDVKRLSSYEVCLHCQMLASKVMTHCSDCSLVVIYVHTTIGERHHRRDRSVNVAMLARGCTADVYVAITCAPSGLAHQRLYSHRVRCHMTNKQASYGKLGITSLPLITRSTSPRAVHNRHSQNFRPQKRLLAYEAHLSTILSCDHGSVSPVQSAGLSTRASSISTKL